MIGFSDQIKNTYRTRIEDGGLKADPYAWLVLGLFGDLYVAGDGLLGVSTHKAGGIAKQIRRLPFVKVVQDGDDGINATFAAEHVKLILRLIKARRRRKLTPERRAKLVEAGRGYHFHGASDAGEAQRQPPSGPRQNGAMSANPTSCAPAIALGCGKGKEHE